MAESVRECSDDRRASDKVAGRQAELLYAIKLIGNGKGADKVRILFGLLTDHEKTAVIQEMTRMKADAGTRKALILLLVPESPLPRFVPVETAITPVHKEERPSENECGTETLRWSFA